MQNWNKYVIFMLLTVAFIGCSDDDELSKAPEIAFKSISPTSATELVDPITLKISYYDEDGDLGENDASVKNLFVTDSRNGVMYEYRIQQLAPTGSEIAIEGELTINIDPLVITDGSASETLSFSIQCKDRAGNSSNVIASSSITINQ